MKTLDKSKMKSISVYSDPYTRLNLEDVGYIASINPCPVEDKGIGETSDCYMAAAQVYFDDAGEGDDPDMSGPYTRTIAIPRADVKLEPPTASNPHNLDKAGDCILLTKDGFVRGCFGHRMRSAV